MRDACKFMFRIILLYLILALKTQNGSYILNGPWALSPSGTYRAAGTTLTYQRGAKHRNECILATGPLNESLYLEILYNEVNPGVLYKYMLPITDGSEKSIAAPPLYFTGPNDPGNEILDSSNHLVTVSVSKMIDQSTKWRDSTQKYDYRVNSHQERPKLVTKFQTTTPMFGDQPKIKKKKRKFNWKVVGFSHCSQVCGGGLQQAIVKCIRESTQTIVNDRRCHHTEKIPNPPTKVCNEKPCETRWKAEPWSECSVTCGTGFRTRKLECIQESNSKETVHVASGACVQPPNLRTVESCTKTPCHSPSPELRHMNPEEPPPRWDVGPWGPCSATCGLGIRNRTVTCITSREPCSQSMRPKSEKSCELMSCSLEDKSSWIYSEWSTKCSAECGPGFEVRQVACTDGSELFCNHDNRPAHERQCFGKEPKCNQAKWFTGPWSSCSKSCGTGIRRRDVICVAIVQGELKIQHEKNCDHTKPRVEENCSDFACSAQWFTSDWSEVCSVTCGGGVRTRVVRCLEDSVISENCTDSSKPIGQLPCNQESCSTNAPPTVVPLDNQYLTSQKVTVRSTVCVDKYPSCSLAVKNNLCRIKYYKHSCCGCRE